MSLLAASSPAPPHKRPFDESDAAATVVACAAGAAKRGRASAAAARGRGSPGRAGAAYAPGPTTAAALCALFPDMPQELVSSILYTCGDDIDAAVRKLSDLRLRGADPAPPDAPAAADAARRAASEPAPAAAAAAAGSSRATSGATTPDPSSVDPWADALVREMAAAVDVADARARAAVVLRAFEAAALDRAGDPAVRDAARAAALERDAGLLKRAVALQASRLAGAAADVAGLRAELAAARERLQAAEMTNFALAAHLRAAAGDGRGAPPPPPPDVC